MKKTLLASAILASLASVSAQAATVYDQDGTTVEVLGGAEVVAVSADSVDGTFGHDNYGYLGLTGTSAISDTATAYASFVIETDDVDASTFAIDDLIIGFDTSNGDFSFGGTDGAIEQVTDMTDIGAYHGGIQEVVSGDGDTGFLYSNTFSGVTVNAEFIASDVKDEDSVGVSALYSADFGLDLGLGYVAVDENSEIAFAVGYTVSDLYLAVGYAVVDYDGDEYTSLELAAQYQVTDAVVVSALLGQAEFEDTDVVDYFAIDASYAINGSASTYVSFKSDNIDGVQDDTEIVAGLVYDF